MALYSHHHPGSKPNRSRRIYSSAQRPRLLAVQRMGRPRQQDQATPGRRAGQSRLNANIQRRRLPCSLSHIHSLQRRLDAGAAILDREWLPLAANLCGMAASFAAATPLIAGWLPSMDLSIGSIGPHQTYLSIVPQQSTSGMYLSNGSGGQPRHRAPRGTHRTQIRQACPCRAPSRRISHQKVEAEANRARRPSAQIVVHAAPEAHLHDEGVWRGGRRRPPSERVEWVRRCAERARICVCG